MTFERRLQNMATRGIVAESCAPASTIPHADSKNRTPAVKAQAYAAEPPQSFWDAKALFDCIMGPIRSDLHDIADELRLIRQGAPYASDKSVDLSSLDLHGLGLEFLKEVLEGETDKAKRSTHTSAFKYWWKTVGLNVYPHEWKVEEFGKICRTSASEDYSLSRQRVMRKFRDWLEDRGIKAPPDNGRVQPQPVQAIEDGAVIANGQTPESMKWLVTLVRESIFGGEPSEDYWATLLRHVASEIGAAGVAHMCNVDTEMAERWIQLGKLPKIAREKLKHTNLLLEIRKAKVDLDKDLDDLWDEALEIEAHITSSLGQDGL